MSRTAARPIPDYAIDKHTVRGKQIWRGFDHWLAEGTVLEPASDITDDYVERARAAWLDLESAKLPKSH